MNTEEEANMGKQSASESCQLIEKIKGKSIDEESEKEKTETWRSMWAHFLTMFFNSIGGCQFGLCGHPVICISLVLLVTTIVYSSLWAYLRQMDPETTTWYLGVIHAGFNIAELCCLVLFGIWVQYRNGFEPLVFSLIFYIIGSALYAWALTFGYHGKYMVLVSRIFMGCATGNDVIVTTLVAEQTTLEERTKAMAYLAIAQSMGFTLGPAIQACFVPVGAKGVYIKSLFLTINMYTLSGIACVLFGIINLVVIIRLRNNFRVTPPELRTDENDNDENDNGSKKENGSKSKGHFGNIWAVIVVLVLFFITRHSLVFIEVMFAPLAMDEYALSSEDTLLIVGVLLAIAGVAAAVIFILTEKITQRIEDRLALVISIFITFLGFVVHWPLSNTYPKQGHYYNVTVHTDEGLEMKRLVTLGCAPTHSWCTTTPIITIPQFAVGFTLIVLSFPVAYCLLPSLFTKMIQSGRQGILVSLFSISGNISRIFGPAIFTAIYSYYGPKGIFGLMDIGLLFSLLLTLIFYKRLIPNHDFVQRNLEKSRGTQPDQEMEMPLLKKEEDIYEPE